MKKIGKSFARFLSLVLTAPLWLMESLAKSALKRDVFFAAHQELLSLFPGKLGSFLRVAYLCRTIDEGSPDCRILFGTVFSHSDAVVHKNVYVGLRCSIGSVEIGEDTMISDHVQILSGRHQHGTSLVESFQNQPRNHRRITVGRNCWIGAGAILMDDVGDNCVIGAGSVVVRPIEPNSVAVGSPARVIKSTTPVGVE
jgi:acetyltransferase-like isoleucine patch superfamily enzyme